MAIKLVQGLSREGDVLKFNETHRTVLLRAETKPFVTALLGKHSLQLILWGVDWQISYIECVTGRVLICWVHRRVIVALEMLIG